MELSLQVESQTSLVSIHMQARGRGRGRGGHLGGRFGNQNEQDEKFYGGGCATLVAGVS